VIVERIETRVVHAESRNWVFVLVRTKDGPTGLGEATLEWKTRAVTGCVEDLAPLFLGRDASDPVALWDEAVLRGYYPLGAVAATALSGIDQALWDVAAKRANAPLWRLLEPKAARESVPAYLNLPNGETPANGFRPDAGAIRAAVAEAKAAGFRAVKWKPVPPGWDGGSGAAGVRALVDEVVSGGLEVALDLHGRTSANAALALARDWPRERVLFVEEPCRPEDLPGYLRFRRGAEVRVATGERLSSRFPFREIVREGIADVLQPDVCRIGGITEAARLAREFPGRALAPHCPLGPVALAASVHLGFAFPSVMMQETFTRDAPWRDEVVAGAPRPERGAFAAPTALGLGPTLDERSAARHPFAEVLPPRPSDPAAPW